MRVFPDLSLIFFGFWVSRLYIYIYIYTRVNLSLYSDSVSGHIARRSDLKLTDSMFCLCIFSSILSMDGRS